MTTQTKSFPWYQKLRAAIKRSKAKGRDNIERSEPDEFTPAIVDIVAGVFLTAFFMMFAYAFMNGSLAVWIGTFLATQRSPLPYEELIAVFTAAVIALCNLVVISAIMVSRTADNDDVVEVVNDLGDQIDERFAEFENRVDDRLEKIEDNVFESGLIDDRLKKISDEADPSQLANINQPKGTN